ASSASRSRRASPASAKAGPLRHLLLDQRDAVTDRVDRVDVLVGDLDVELVLEGEHHVHEASGVHLQILEDVRRRPCGGERLLVLHVGRQDLDHPILDLLGSHVWLLSLVRSYCHLRSTSAALTSPKPKPAFIITDNPGSSRVSCGIEAAKGAISGCTSSQF